MGYGAFFVYTIYVREEYTIFVEVTRAEWGHHDDVEQQATKEAADGFDNGRQARGSSFVTLGVPAL